MGRNGHKDERQLAQTPQPTHALVLLLLASDLLMLPDIVHLRFDARTHPIADERIAAWADVMSLSVDVTVRPEHRDGFEAQLDFYPLGSVLLVNSAATPQTVSRSRRTIARTGDGQVILDIFMQGGFSGLVDGCSLTIGSGDGFLMDYRGTMRVHLSDARYIGVVMPRALWDEHAGALDVHGLRLDAASAEAQLLGRMLDALVQQAPDLTPTRAAALGIGLVGLIHACITAEEPPSTGLRFTPNEATLIRIRRYIEQHAVDPGVDAEHLCEAFKLSRSALYRICQNDGGVASLIRRRLT